jgi:hypothetical protein
MLEICTDVCNILTKNRNVQTNFSSILQYRISRKSIQQFSSYLMHTDTQQSLTCTTRFKTANYILSTQWIQVIRVILTTNINYVPILHSQTGLLNGSSVLYEVRTESVYKVNNAD